jgi:hypothetical protein
MRFASVAILLVLALTRSASAQESKRFGISRDAKTYPQATARETLASVLKAIDDKRIHYLVAYLADPTFVDDRVKRIYAGKFEEQVQDTQARLDPGTVKLLRRFLKEGKWAIDKDKATVTLDEIKDRAVHLARKGEHWYLLHRFDASK